MRFIHFFIEVSGIFSIFCLIAAVISASLMMILATRGAFRTGYGLKKPFIATILFMGISVMALIPGKVMAESNEIITIHICRDRLGNQYFTSDINLNKTQKHYAEMNKFYLKQVQTDIPGLICEYFSHVPNLSLSKGIVLDLPLGAITYDSPFSKIFGLANNKKLKILRF